MNIANKKDFVYSFCNDHFNKFHRYCCEWYLYNFLERRGFWFDLNESRKQPPNKFGYMPPKYITT